MISMMRSICSCGAGSSSMKPDSVRGFIFSMAQASHHISFPILRARAEKVKRMMPWRVNIQAVSRREERKIFVRNLLISTNACVIVGISSLWMRSARGLRRSGNLLSEAAGETLITI